MTSIHEIQTGLGRLAPAIALAMIFTGCASHKFVRNQDQATRAELAAEIDEVGSTVEAVQTDLAELDGTVERQGGEIQQVSQTAQDALERAIAAGKLAEGKLLYETVLSDDRVRFGFEEATLSDEARSELDRFAEQLKTENGNVYIEIQGHTDTTGPESYNMILGEQRAESVRRYLNQEHGLPLHRMATISYGESAPIADNSTREGRAKNRRVSLVVLG